MILSTSNNSTAPRDLAAFHKLVETRYAQMSPQFHHVARYFVDNSDEVALAPVRVLAVHIGVHSSTIVRFAKYMNYQGFKELQLVFKAAMYSRAQGLNSRISRLDHKLASRGKHKTDDGVRNVIAAEITSLQNLLENLSISDLERAVKLIASARIVWVICDLDGVPIGQHLTRMLSLLPRDARLVEGSSMRSVEVMRLVKAGDVVVAIELSSESASAPMPEIKAALKNGCKLIVIASDPRPPEGGHVTLHASTNNTPPAPTLAGPMTLVHILGLQVANRTSPSRFRLPEVAQFDPLGW